MRSPLLLGLCVALLGVSLPLSAQVVGIDLGSEFIKVASVRRSDGIEIVLNEQTRRKTPNYVGFRGKDRYIGEDAKNLVGRFPDLMVGMLNRLIGASLTEGLSEWYHRDVLFTNEISPVEARETIGVQLTRFPQGGKVLYAVETLFASIFDYIRAMTFQFTGDYASKQDAVVVVPHFFDMQQRRALAQSASMGNTNVIATMHTTTAVALQYGVQNRGFGNATKHVLVYDMGASKAEAGVYTFSPAASGAKRSESLGTLTTRAIVSDPFLGGRSFDACLARMIASDLQEKSGIDVLSDFSSIDSRKGIAVLVRSANRAKEILGTNKQCPVTVEGIAKGRDHSTVVSRQAFEAKCAPLFERAARLAERAIAASGIDFSDLHAFEVHGGGVRVPRLIDALSEAYGRPVQRTLNGDESAVLGAAFHAARVSATFGVKGFAVVEALPYNVTFTFSPKPGAATEEQNTKKRSLFAASQIPAKKSVSVNRTEDFATTFYAESGPMQTLRISGVHEALAKVGHFAPERDPMNSFHIRMETKLDGCGVLSVSSATLKYKQFVLKQREVGKAISEEEVSEKEAEEGAAETESVLAPEPELKKHDIPLQMEWEYLDRPPLSTKSLETELRMLKEQESYEMTKRAIAQARNDLEALLIAYEGEALEALRNAVEMSDAQQESLSSTIREVKEWLYDGDGLCDDTPADSFRARHQEIMAVVDGIRYAGAAADALPPLEDDVPSPETAEETQKSPEEL